jgi:threonine synthase
MRYTSTRDPSVSINAAGAIVKGISNDGGLFVPDEIPAWRRIQSGRWSEWATRRWRPA